VSWVYWGIVTGLVALVAMLFVCVDVTYSNAKEGRHASAGAAGGPIDANKDPSTASRRAA
jgi:hypothetical protein